MRLYRDFTTQEEIDAQYNPMSGQDPKVVLQGFVEKSERARERLAHQFDLKYGPTRAEYLDFFPAGQAGAPLHVFFHGGYWRSLSAREFSYVAEGLVEQGVSVAIVNYELCPKVCLGEIVRQCRASLAWLHGQADVLDIDRQKITVSGHSAGGHLVAMLLATDWPADYDLPADLIKGACAVSGLFDLSPFPYSWLQPRLQLTGRDIRELSPVFCAVEAPCPLVLLVGGNESDEFHRQSAAYFEHWQRQTGLPGLAPLSVPKADHFRILDEIYSRSGSCFNQLHALT